MNGAKDQQTRINEAIGDCSQSNFRLMVVVEAGVGRGEGRDDVGGMEANPLLDAGAGKGRDDMRWRWRVRGQSSVLAFLSDLGSITQHPRIG